MWVRLPDLNVGEDNVRCQIAPENSTVIQNKQKLRDNSPESIKTKNVISKITDDRTMTAVQESHVVVWATDKLTKSSQVLVKPVTLSA